MKLERNAQWLMLGDSVTDCGRARPTDLPYGDVYSGLGGGYVALIASLLDVFYPERRIVVRNVGVSGDTTRHLDDRWSRDVADLRPDWLSILIGANDVWRQFDRTLRPGDAVPPEQYEEILDRRIGEIRPSLKGLVLAAPFMVEPQTGDAMRRRMEEYARILARLAAKHDALFVDTQAAFDRTLERSGLYSTSLSGDRVHPNAAGHMLLARTLLDAVGFDWTHAGA